VSGRNGRFGGCLPYESRCFDEVFDLDSDGETQHGEKAAHGWHACSAANVHGIPTEIPEVTVREDQWAAAMRAERRGDAAAYEVLLKEIAVMLRRLIRSRLARAGLGVDETEDVVQEILIGLHGKRHTWDATRPFMPWLFTITRYKFIDASRRLSREAKRRVNLTMEEMTEIFEAPIEDPDRTLSEIDRYLADLPQGQRQVVRALVDGATVRATAEQLRTSEGSVRVSYHRALRRLMAKAQRENAP
jgi:RNA polymerase sigma-70 factor (ECF subfamily)